MSESNALSSQIGRKDRTTALLTVALAFALFAILFPTPREKKRFINRVRYLAMRREQTVEEKTYGELLRDWFRKREEDQAITAAQRSDEARSRWKIWIRYFRRNRR